MPGSLFAWYTLYDLDALAAREAVLSGEIELRKLTRLRELLHSDSGIIEASLKFRRNTIGSVSVDLAFEAALEIVCQRCLEPLERDVREQVSVTLLESELTESEAAKKHDAVVLTDGKVSPAALIEDELIVSLPIIPRHSDINECGTIVDSLRALLPEEQPGETDPTSRNR